MTLAGIDIRINAAAKKFVEARIKRLPLEDAAANLIPGKSGQVTGVKKKRVAPHNRLGQELVIANESEQLVAPLPSGQVTGFVSPPDVVEFSRCCAFHGASRNYFFKNSKTSAG
jgi:hypothetical protein